MFARKEVQINVDILTEFVWLTANPIISISLEMLITLDFF